MNVFWAVGYPVTVIALHTGESPTLLAALRLTVAFILTSPWLRRVTRWSWSLVGYSAGLGIIGFSLPIWLQIVGLHGTDAAIAALSVSLEPLITILLAALAFRSKISPWQKIAVVLAVLGCWILTGEPRPGHLDHITADAALILSVLSFTVYNVYSSQLARTLQPQPAAALTFGFGALGSVILFLLDPGTSPVHFSWSFMWTNAYLAFIATGLCYWLWLSVVTRHSITVSALYLFIQPLIGTVISIILGQSLLTLSLVLGGLFVLGAMFLGREPSVQ